MNADERDAVLTFLQLDAEVDRARAAVECMNDPVQTWPRLSPWQRDERRDALRVAEKRKANARDRLRVLVSVWITEEPKA